MKIEKELNAIREKIRAELIKAESIIDQIGHADPGAKIREARQGGKIIAYREVLKLLN